MRIILPRQKTDLKLHLRKRTFVPNRQVNNILFLKDKQYNYVRTENESIVISRQRL